MQSKMNVNAINPPTKTAFVRSQQHTHASKLNHIRPQASLQDEAFQPHEFQRILGEIRSAINLPDSQSLPQISAPQLPDMRMPQAPDLHFPDAGQAVSSLMDTLTATSDALKQQALSSTTNGTLPHFDFSHLNLPTTPPIDVPALDNLQPHYGTAVASQLLNNLNQVINTVITQLTSSTPLNTDIVQQTVDKATQFLKDVQGFEMPSSASWTTLQQLPAAFNLSSAAASVNPSESLSQAMVTLTSLVAKLETMNVDSVMVGGYSLKTVLLLFAGLTALTVGATALQPKASDNKHGSLPTQYNAQVISAYYSARPTMVAQRALSILREFAPLGIGLLTDFLSGDIYKNSPTRSKQLRIAIENLGPAFVKVAQAFSTRVDILDEHYLREIEQLQDNVPPFSDVEARDVIAAAFGMPVENAFESISPSPVAAASLGQVYKGILKSQAILADGTTTTTSTEVAIKVRRPDVLESVSLDLYIMRSVAEGLKQFPQVRSDWAAIIDEWATAFFAELDYQQEATNARRFAADVERYNISGVVVPEVVVASNNGVLVTQWIDGEKLCESTASDVRELCNTLLSSYLIQLLDSCFLHADPHPGNLLRTTDGKLAILDYGLMTEVPAEYAIALVDYIAHLQMEDWDAITDDLVSLGFVPEWAPSPRESGIAAPLGAILSQLVQGGGAAAVDIPEVTRQLEHLTDLYPYFQVPPYFALILRCFSVIEGIALRVDPTYSIVKECFPYLARRLLTDDSPQARAALKKLLYGKGDRIDYARLERLTSGLQQFTVEGLQPTLSGGGGSSSVDNQAAALAAVGVDTEGPVLNEAMKQTLKAVLNPNKPSYAQEIIAEEAAATIDAAGRFLLGAVLGRALQSVPAMMGSSAVEALGPLRPVLFPGPTPQEVLTRLVPFIELTDSDRHALSVAENVGRMLPRPAEFDSQAAARTMKLANELAPMVPELLPGVFKTGEMVGRSLLRRAVDRFRESSGIANDMDV